MLFVETRFFVFFALVALVYWGMRSNQSRKWLLLLASNFFYGAWDPWLLSLIWFCILLNYFCARAVLLRDVRLKRAVFWAAIVANLGVLFTFKYAGFFAQSFLDLARLLGAHPSPLTLEIVLPVGISFYTFQAMSYTIDVHRGDVPPRYGLLDVALYIMFFPQLVAGPIVRAADFLPQLDRARTRADVGARAAVLLFLIGFFKKACVSDNIAPYVDLVFNDPSGFDAAANFAGVFLYAVQIYCDFSGYTDMAIGCAGLLGYQFVQNFNAPYLAADITDFWRRWHISLSTWLRDYLYIPLGGNRAGEAKRNRNLMITMVLGGLWHGASYNFLIWGLMHGAALVVARAWSRNVPRLLKPLPLARLLGWALTFYWVCLAWIFFRAVDLPTALGMARTFLTGVAPGTQELHPGVWLFLLLFGAGHYLAYRFRLIERAVSLPPLRFAMLLGAGASLAVSLTPVGYRPFVYFQF